MPQFDVFLFFSSVFYLLVGFFSLMFFNQFMFLPKISAFLKLREKIVSRKLIAPKKKIDVFTKYCYIFSKFKISKSLKCY